MARHEVVIHQNTGALSEVAPYTGSYISKETVAESAFVESVAAKCGLPAIQVAAIIDGSFEAIEELERAGLVRVHTDLGLVCGVITGSFPTADAEFDPERNSLQLALRLDDSIRLSLADATPSIVTDETITKLRVDNVMDLAEERPMNLIHGQHVFRVAGFNMVLGDEGAAVYLQDKNGTTYPIVVDEVVSKQLFKAHTAELLQGGDYKLVVKSRAGDAEGPLQTAFRRVKYLRVEGPTVTKIATGNDEEESPAGVIYGAQNLRIHGSGLALGEGESVTYTGTLNGEPVNGSFEAGAAQENTDVLLAWDYTDASGDPLMFDDGSEVTFSVKGLEVTATFREYAP